MTSMYCLLYFCLLGLLIMVGGMERLQMSELWLTQCPVRHLEAVNKGH
jgi:hypothetical protein